MATWEDLRSYIKNNYKIAEDNLDSVKLIFDVGGQRSQAVRVANAGENWATVSTAVCRGDQIDPADALRRNWGMRIGGLAALEDGTVIFKHSFPLASLDPGEFEEPLHMAVNYGDALERELTGGGDTW